MKISKRLSSVIAMVILLVSVSITSVANDINTKNDNQTTITEPYSYPVVLGTANWRALKTHVDKIDACQIPEEILKKMTTESLVETILTYPLLVDMFAWNTPEIGYNAVYEQFNGLRELAERPDALEVLNNKNNGLSSETESLDSLYIKIIKSGISSKQGSLAETRPVKPLYTSTYVYTPKGSPVLAYKDLTWADHGITAAQAEQQFNDLLQAYPYAIRVANNNPAYNCHSYAWYSSSTSNTYWIDNPSSYMSDGSYNGTTAAASGRKLFYDYPGGIAYDHSGNVFSVYSSYVGVRSKWGYLGLVEHDKSDCPYALPSTAYTYWY